MQHRVERISGLAETLDAELGQRGVELVGNGRKRATLQITVLAGQVDVVQHRQQCLDDATDSQVTM